MTQKTPMSTMKGKMKKTIIPDQLNTLLINLGLTEKEATLYEHLLKKGAATAGELIELSGLKRGITYAVLYSLEHKKLIRSFEKGSKTTFQVEPPAKLQDLVEHKKQQVEIMENSVKHVIKDLTSQYKLAVGKPTVQYFEGEEGLEKVFADIYSPKEDAVYGCVDLEKADAVFPQHIVKKYIPLRVKNNLKAVSFVGDSTQSRKLKPKDTEHLRETHLLDKKEYPLPAEIDVYEDKISMMSFDKGNFIGLIIENKDFAETLRSIFKYAVDKARKEEKIMSSR